MWSFVSVKLWTCKEIVTSYFPSQVQAAIFIMLWMICDQVLFLTAAVYWSGLDSLHADVMGSGCIIVKCITRFVFKNKKIWIGLDEGIINTLTSALFF